MPELPDLVYIAAKLQVLVGRTLKAVEIMDPILLRNNVGAALESRLSGATVSSVFQRAPFLTIQLDSHIDLITNPMLAGRFSLWNERLQIKRASLILDFAGLFLAYSDDRRMGKIYAIEQGSTDLIPKYDDPGLDLLDRSAFTLEAFLKELSKARQQVRVFLMDSRHIRDVGNAYADEILFQAKLHPKTFVYQLTEAEKATLYEEVKAVIHWGIDEVAKAGAPIQEKTRGHMRVRNRKNDPCPRCGTKIRRVAVLSSDAFFCPHCQPARRDLFIDWAGAGKTPKGRA